MHHAQLEQIRAQILELGARQVGQEVLPIAEAVQRNRNLGCNAKCALRALTGRAQSSQRALVAADILAGLALELLDKMVDHPVVEIVAAEVGVAGRRLYLEQEH